MKISMLANFKILKKNEDGKFVPMNNSEARSVSIGGFSFDVNGHSVPFDWDAFTGFEENGVFKFATGRGWAFNDFELADYYDNDYADIGIKRENISAEFLASVEHIEEFFVNFEDGDKEVGVGYFNDNAKEDAEYKLELIEISFEDIEACKYYDVTPEVLDAFNKGECGLVISQEEMVQMSDRGEKRLHIQIKEDMADLASQISRCELIAGEQKVGCKGSIERDER